METSDSTIQISLQLKWAILFLAAKMNLQMKSYLPKQNEIFQYSQCNENTVDKCISQKKYKIFVICKIDAIINLKKSRRNDLIWFSMHF